MKDTSPGPGMEIQKVYVLDNDRAVIVCRNCGAEKTTNAAPFLHKPQVRVKCRCGFTFTVSFEKRRHYRKTVTIAGTYSRNEPSRDAGEMVVEDLSFSGLRFRTHFKSKLQAGDIVKVQFTLDDNNKSVITRTVIVRRVLDRVVGAEFCDGDICRPLSFYLRP